MRNLKAIRGMHDILPQDMVYWRHLETVFRECVESYGYREIRTPIVESTALFKRSVGETTDIVAKEMYTFTDRNQDSLTLRPEGTAGVVRAGIEHSLFYQQSQRLWYSGANFRHERPQKGRYRQFYQFGVEAFGMPSPNIDIELLFLTWRFWQRLQLTTALNLQINSLGTFAERQQYNAALVDYLSQHLEQLDADSKIRLHKNPLRILDSKNPKMQSLLENVPKINEFLGTESKTQFAQICTALTTANIPYVINPRLVRGLDYYCYTVYEWVSNQMTTQATVCAGGRYDGLVTQLGGDATPATGFAFGVERLIFLLKQQMLSLRHKIAIYFVSVGAAAQQRALFIAEEIHDALPEQTMITHCSDGSFKSQLKKADKSDAEIALILGENEVTAEKIIIKYLRQTHDQEIITLVDLLRKLKKIFREKVNELS